MYRPTPVSGRFEVGVYRPSGRLLAVGTPCIARIRSKFIKIDSTDKENQTNSLLSRVRGLARVAALCTERNVPRTQQKEIQISKGSPSKPADLCRLPCDIGSETNWHRNQCMVAQLAALAALVPGLAQGATHLVRLSSIQTSCRFNIARNIARHTALSTPPCRLLWECIGPMLVVPAHTLHASNQDPLPSASGYRRLPQSRRPALAFASAARLATRPSACAIPTIVQLPGPSTS